MSAVASYKVVLGDSLSEISKQRLDRIISFAQLNGWKRSMIISVVRMIFVEICGLDLGKVACNRLIRGNLETDSGDKLIFFWCIRNIFMIDFEELDLLPEGDGESYVTCYTLGDVCEVICQKLNIR